MAVRILVALFLLLQPLPALGLQLLLPCAAGCGHCGATVPADAGCGCENAEENAEPSCPCVHEAPAPQPSAPAPGPEQTLNPAISAIPCAAPAWTDCRILRSIQSVPEELGHDPPPSLPFLCVWRN